MTLLKPDPHALAAADTIAETLTDPATTSAGPSRRFWPQSLVGGAAGIALLHIERAATGHADWEPAHRWLTAATADPLTEADNACLTIGAPALAFITHAANQVTGGYRTTLATLDQATINITHRRLAHAHRRLSANDRPLLREFDLLRGLTGLAAYHLRRHPDHPINSDVLAYLIRLTEHLPGNGPLPPWWTNTGPTGDPNPDDPNPGNPASYPDPDYPHGHGNLGVSHGISGVLAVLSLAVLHGRRDPGIESAIGRICAWSDQWRCETGGPWWPSVVTTPTPTRPLTRHDRPRPSWCYGAAGTARAQQLAGRALDDDARQKTAEAAILAAVTDPDYLNQLDGRDGDFGLCHGTAGLLQAAWRTTETASSPAIANALPALTTRLMTQVAGPVTAPELLDGAAGAALTLHTLGTATSPASGWDRLFLLD